ncbi:right-handed parallel beta-helix repeat-containing protein [Rathayibacter soli]|uniref:right-handed parallel beta-helix repeat-containing protein n=1 Tax=Rathayibacter soli TaxID=3144168 RepID=UPI0027E52495|nr:right-handed parallel beta-helix repeat-containing protein [Glaciibacter superstes]
MSVKRRMLAVAIAGVMGLSGCLLTAMPAAARTPDGQAHYVDCSASTPGDGGVQSPWNSLSQVNAQTFGAGQELLFKRGVQCVGELEPQGSGSAASPFVISDYGTAHTRAAIEGGGAEAAVKLYNEQHITLSNLEITNSASPASQRRGVLVQLQDYGVGHGYLLKNLDVHDVLGGDLKGPNGSQGIAFKVSGSSVSTSFDGVDIVGNRLDHVDRQGIVIVLSTWSNRAEVGSTAPENWVPSTHVVIERNVLTDIGGDGIVMNTTDGALVQRNTVSGFNERSAAYNAGVWDYNTDNSLLQYNDVSGGRTHLDGMAYDVDQGNIATTFQYNYSHDNEGGFFLLCNNGPGVIREAVVRDNFSSNDSYRGIENCKGAIESARFSNNTIYIGDGVSQTVVNENTTSLRNVAFDDNIVYKTGAGVADFNLRSGGYTFAGNVFAGVQNAPQQSVAGRVVGRCAAGATSGYPAVEAFQYLTHGHDANFAALASDANLGRYFGADSKVTAPQPSGVGTRC